MAKLNELCDDLIVKILSFLPIKEAVSTSVLSKQWKFRWMWLTELKYDDYDETTDIDRLNLYDFIDKNLPLHRAPVIEIMRLSFCFGFLRPEELESWAEIAVSRRVRKLSISYSPCYKDRAMLLPSSLYTCKSLVTLKLEDFNILVDVPPTGSLPSLKTLKLICVTYSDKDSLQLLLSYCPVLEELIVKRNPYDDNLRATTVIVPSLQRLSLTIGMKYSSDDGYVIDTPSLKYFKVLDYRGIDNISYLIKYMPKLEEADINVEHNPEKLLMSITSVKRLSLHINLINKEEPVYHADIGFNKLQHLKLHISNDYWSKLLIRLLKDSPKLRVLKLLVQIFPRFEEYQPRINFNSLTKGISVPKCLLESLETFHFEGYKGRPEERDFLSFLFKNARCLTSSIIRESSLFDYGF